jgi:hypothetical protein
MTHGPPLAVPSCSPPTERSAFLTAQAPERVGAHFGAADGTGLVTLKVTCLNPGTTQQVTGSNVAPPCADPGDQIDVKVTSTSTGVRCKTISGGCGAVNALYGGQVLGVSQIRITDHYNAISPNPPGADCSDTTSCTATAIDLPFSIGSNCSAGSCNYVTSADLTVPAVVLEGKRSVVGLGPIEIQDAGADGALAGATCPPTCAQNGVDHDVAATQGLFIP